MADSHTDILTITHSQTSVTNQACVTSLPSRRVWVQVVGEMLQAMQVLLDRLSALQMMLLQKPVVSGHYTSAPYHNLLQPLDQYVRAVMESAVQLGALTAELLSERCTDASLEAVQAQIKQLEQLRWLSSPPSCCLHRMMLWFDGSMLGLSLFEAHVRQLEGLS